MRPSARVRVSVFGALLSCPFAVRNTYISSYAPPLPWVSWIVRLTRTADLLLLLLLLLLLPELLQIPASTLLNTAQ